MNARLRRLEAISRRDVLQGLAGGAGTAVSATLGATSKLANRRCTRRRRRGSGMIRNGSERRRG